MSKSESTAKKQTFAALRNRDFRLFWTGLVLSGVGSQFTSVAMAWQIYELTDSAFQIGLLGLARAVPQFALLLFGGLLADAMDRRRLMIATQIGQMAVSATLAIMTLMGQTTPAALYAASMLLALFGSLETPARQALVPNLVPRQDLTSALALTGSQRQVATIAGPSLAGVVLTFSGPGACYATDAISWLAMIASLLAIHARPEPGRGRSAISLRSLREGVEFVWTHPVILNLMVLDLGVNVFGSVRALLPVYARDILSVGPGGLGILYTAPAVGAIVVATVMSTIGRVRRAGLWVLIGVAIYGGCTVLFSLSRSFWFSFLMLAGVGGGNSISVILRGTINQLTTPDELRGRVTSVNSIFTNTGPQLGQFESGAVAALLGAQMSALTGGLATLVIVASVAAVPRVRLLEIGETLELVTSRPRAAGKEASNSP
jgi:MFS family permease